MVDTTAGTSVRFSIGGVFAVAGRAFARQYALILLLCLLAGLATPLIGPLSLLDPTALAVWLLAAPWPVHEFVLALAPAIIVGPIVALTLRALANRHASPLEAIRRLPATTAAALIAQLIAFGPGHLIAPLLATSPFVKLGTIFGLFLYQMAAFAFGFVVVGVVTAETCNPWRAVLRTAQLIRGRWVRVSVVAFGLWTIAYLIDNFATAIALRIAFESFWWAWIIAAIAASIRLGILFVAFGAIYYLLRSEVDGPSPHDAAQVFD